MRDGNWTKGQVVSHCEELQENICLAQRQWEKKQVTVFCRSRGEQRIAHQVFVCYYISTQIYLINYISTQNYILLWPQINRWGTCMDFDCWCLEGYRQKHKRYIEAENIQQWRYSRRHLSKAFLRKVVQKFGTIAFRKKNINNKGQ